MKLTRKSLDSDADTLREWLKRLEARDLDSLFLRTRIAYNEEKQVLTQYLPHYVACAKCQRMPDDHTDKKLRHKYNQPVRVYPNLLPTQASGRWSVTDPPKVTEPHPFQEEVILPDPGTAWVCWDLDAIEAKLVACYSDDEEDLDAFANDYDIHTITSCNMFGDPLPKNLTDPHASLEDAEWRAARNWKGKHDKRRGLAKVRYCVYYGRDHRAAEDSGYAKEFVKKGGDRKELVEAARLFLKSKPNLVATKKKWWAICGKACEARTFFGRRRRLFGDEWKRMKEGWNHMIQGSVVEMVNISIIELDAMGFPLVYPSHDAAMQIVTDHDLRGAQKAITLQKFHNAIVKEYVVNGHKIITTSSDACIKYPDGSEEAIAI